MSGISTHILDVTLGRPAAGVGVRLDRKDADAWIQVGSAATDLDGRCRNVRDWSPLEAAEYRLTFEVGAYFEWQRIQALYREIAVAFAVLDPNQNYHIPLLLAPNGYTTYRGS